MSTTSQTAALLEIELLAAAVQAEIEGMHTANAGYAMAGKAPWYQCSDFERKARELRDLADRAMRISVEMQVEESL